MKNLKSKVLTGLAVASVVAQNALADVTMSGDGAVSGKIEMTTFYGVAGVVIVALGSVFAVKTGLRLLR